MFGFRGHILSRSQERASPSRTFESRHRMGKTAYTEKWRPATSSVDGKDGEDAVTDRADARAGSHRTLKIAVLQSYALGT
jgi:hypothetical protein